MYIRVEIPEQLENGYGNTTLGVIEKRYYIWHEEVTLKCNIANSARTNYINEMTYFIYLRVFEKTYMIMEEEYNRITEILKKLNIEQAEEINKKYMEAMKEEIKTFITVEESSIFNPAEINAITGLEVE